MLLHRETLSWGKKEREEESSELANGRWDPLEEQPVLSTTKPLSSLNLYSFKCVHTSLKWVSQPVEHVRVSIMLSIYNGPFSNNNVKS